MSNIHALCQQLAEQLINNGLTMATAESCTGGGIGARLTDLAGSSAWFNGGVISYTNEAKQNLLGVSEINLIEYGAVSEQVVLEMAAGACRQLQADLAVAVSGVAGPAGGSVEKPVGTVWIAWSWVNKNDSQVSAAARCYHFDGDRGKVREATIEAALSGLLSQINESLMGLHGPPS